MTILYLPDAKVDDTLETELRTLLSLSFGDAFKNKRYHFELPAHRWLIREEDVLVAHLAIHDKTFQSEGKSIPFLGVAEVCVAPSHRGRGLVKAMLREAEARFRTVPFAILLGDPGVYASSGYRLVGNVYFPASDAGKPSPDVMVKALGHDDWPEGHVTIAGPPF